LDANLKLISARLSEPGVTLAAVQKMIERQVRKWKGTQMEDYLRPATLFGKSKFDSYYAAREDPVQMNQPGKPTPRPDLVTRDIERLGRL
jgi:uncharacterized phage protein (TIGR02220 family)